MQAIEMRHVTKERGGFTIADLNISIPKGYITGFIGPNGSGKTTTIQLMMNTINLDNGEIKIFNQDHTNHQVKQNIGFVYDDLYMYEEYSIRKMKSFIAPLYNTWNNAVFDVYLEKFDLPLNKKIKHFSKGMKMKCSLLFALAHDPELLIMDEPTSGLDPIIRYELLDLLQEWMTAGDRTIFLSTHLTTDLDRVADFIIFINKGKVVFQKNMEEIRDQFQMVQGKRAFIDADSKTLFHGLEMKDVGFRGLYSGTPAILEPFKDELIMEEATLENIMYYMTRSE